jgi:poly(hydroxyalkanoate) depolymerase family esterase
VPTNTIPPPKRSCERVLPGSARTRLRALRLSTALLLHCAAVLCVPDSANAASLQEVQGFGNSPSNAKMFLYVPDKLAVLPPVLVAIHYCGGSASQYFNGTGYRALSDQYGFIVIYPQTTSSDGCFDVHSSATLKHDGGSDSASIVSMVRHVVAKHGANAGRVYVAGTSSGAMMTNVLLGAYPDVFQGGASFAGVPFACFAGTGAWNNACATGQTTKSGPAWGDLVRAAYPGYAGPRPRVQLWHGDRDETLNFHNFGEAIKQWTNVLGVSEQPTTTERDAPQRGFTRTRYTDAAGIVRVEAVLEAGMTHNLSVPAAEVVRFFGLDGKTDPGAEPSMGNAMPLADAGAGSVIDGGNLDALADGGLASGNASGAKADASADAGKSEDAALGADRREAGAAAQLPPEAGHETASPAGARLGDDASDGSDADDAGGCSAQPRGTRADTTTTSIVLVLIALLRTRLRRVRRKPTRTQRAA